MPAHTKTTSRTSKRLVQFTTCIRVNGKQGGRCDAHHAGSLDQDPAQKPVLVEVRMGLRLIRGTNLPPTPLWKILGVDW